SDAPNSAPCTCTRGNCRFRNWSASSALRLKTPSMNRIDSYDDSARLLEQVRQAAADRAPLRIRGAGSKAFLGRPMAGTDIDTCSHCGIVAYEPSELVMTVRAGTPLSFVNAALQDANQMLPCEPPTF